MKKLGVGWRTRLASVGTAAVLVGVGLTVGSGTPVHATQVVQNGPVKNYAGPGPCPAGTVENSPVNPCLITNGDIDVKQTASGVGSANIVESGSATQSVTAIQGGGAPNTVTCNQQSGDAADVSSLLCKVTQAGDNGNAVKVAMSAHPNHMDFVTSNSITQNNQARLIVDQSSNSGPNTVAGDNPSTAGTMTVDQRANQQVNLNTPLSHTQDGFALAYVKQIASTSGNNTVNLFMDRNQSSITRGMTPTQNQDSGAIPTAEGLCQTPARNGNVCLYQRTDSGTQKDTIRAADEKDEQATDISLMNQHADQQQGPSVGTGGWLLEVDMDQGAAGTGTADLGDRNSCPPDVKTDCEGASPAASKRWSMTAVNLVGQPISGTSGQNDGIGDYLKGLSPCTATAASWTKLIGRAGTKQTAALDSFGHTKCAGGWSGYIAAQMNDQGKRINWDNLNSVSAHIGCTDTVNGAGSDCSTITVEPATFSAVEGSATPSNTTIAKMTDPNPSDTAESFSATAAWGDDTSSSVAVIPDTGAGAGHYLVVGSHTYIEKGTYPVTVTVSRSSADHSQVGSANSTANVADAAIHLASKPDVFASGATFEGAVATLTDDNPYGTAADFATVSSPCTTAGPCITWGDGQSSVGTLSPSSGTGPWTVSGSHTYANAGNQFFVNVAAKDKDGSTANTAAPGMAVTTYKCATGGCFTMGDRAPLVVSQVPQQVYFWGNDWSAKNPVSAGNTAGPSFKGFNGNNAPACSIPKNTWTSSGGTSPPPAGTLPQYMLVAVTSSIAKAGSVISGNVVKLVVVKTDPTYSPNSGGTGTGKYVTTICSG